MRSEMSHRWSHSAAGSAADDSMSLRGFASAAPLLPVREERCACETAKRPPRPAAMRRVSHLALFISFVSVLSTGTVRADEPPHYSFRNHVQPVLAKFGCSSGACHGAAAGQNG